MDNLNYSNGVKKISLASPSLASQRRFQIRSRLPAAGERYPLESAPSPTSSLSTIRERSSEHFNRGACCR